MTDRIERAREKAFKAFADDKGSDMAGVWSDSLLVFLAALEEEGLCIVPKGALEGALHDVEDGQLEGAILMIKKMLAPSLERNSG